MLILGGKENSFLNELSKKINNNIHRSTPKSASFYKMIQFIKFKHIAIYRK